MIPGAVKATTKNTAEVASTMCGGGGGLVSESKADASITICCK
jgi:hypothetical protein